MPLAVSGSRPATLEVAFLLTALRDYSNTRPMSGIEREVGMVTSGAAVVAMMGCGAELGASGTLSLHEPRPRRDCPTWQRKQRLLALSLNQ
jgi:hypothetical protein